MELDNDIYVDATETQAVQGYDEAHRSRLEPPVVVASTGPHMDLDNSTETRDAVSLRHVE